MKPFDIYPGDGAKLLPKKKGGNARRGYGFELMRLTGQTCCASCDDDLVGDYHRWLLISVDHVIPVGESKRLGIPEDIYDSYSNLVLCCLGCNGFDNRYPLCSQDPERDWRPRRFFELRNRVFVDRKERILKRRSEEINFFSSTPWSHPK
jgi:hypothetical protein